MKRVITFLILAIVFSLLISCGGTRKCITSKDNKIINPTLTEVTLIQTEVT